MTNSLTKQEKKHKRPASAAIVGNSRGTQAPSSQTIQRAQLDPQRLTSGDVSVLQRSIGNSAVVDLLGKRKSEAQTGAQAGAQIGTQSAPPTIQRKLDVGPADDQYEREADELSDSVMRSAGASKSSSSPSANAVQRAAIGLEGGVLSGDTENRLRQSQGSGSSLPNSVRGTLEPKLGADLSQVKVHTDSAAVQLSQEMGAKAFTHQNHIYYGKGHSPSDLKLTAHEAVHTIQQGAVSQTPQRKPSSADEGNVIQRDFLGKKSGMIDNAIDVLYQPGENSNKQTTDKLNNQKQLVKTYVAKFDNKPTDKQAKKDLRDEEKGMQKLLHFPKKETKTTDENRRNIYRTTLLAEAARGVAMPTLLEFRQFMLGPGLSLGESDYMNLLQGKTSAVNAFTNAGTRANVSLALLNAFIMHRDNPYKEIDEALQDLGPKARKLAPEAIQVSSQSDESSIIYLRTMVKKMLGLVDRIAEARFKNEIFQARNMAIELKPIFNTVWGLNNYAQMKAKSNLKSENETGTSKRLGGGQVNKVFEVNYDSSKNTSITHGVFKQEPREFDVIESPGAKESGIPEFNPNFSGRSVATSKVDELLGLGMAPKTEFGSHDTMGGTVQDWAKGNSPQKMTLEGLSNAPQTKFRQFDYSDPEIQRQLATLQIFDVITGQVDRHPGNYYIYQGPGGTQITAIDNDLAFGKNKDVDRIVDPVWRNRGLPQDHSRGIPLFLDINIGEQILKTTDKDFKDTITNLLSDEEVDKAMTRFAKVKVELRKKKANTARIKALQRRLDVFTKYEGRFGSKKGGVEDALSTQIDWIRLELSKLYGQGALLDQSEWGAKIAQYLTIENSYYGVLMDQVSEYSKQGKMIPVDS